MLPTCYYLASFHLRTPTLTQCQFNNDELVNWQSDLRGDSILSRTIHLSSATRGIERRNAPCCLPPCARFPSLSSLLGPFSIEQAPG